MAQGLLEALADNSEQFRAVFAAARIGVWQRDLRTMQVSCTDQCRAHFGLAPGEPLDWARLTGDLVHPDDLERVRAAAQHGIETRSDCSVDYRVFWPDGSLHWVAIRGRAEYDGAGVPLRLTGVTFDITERRRAEQMALEQSRLLEMVAAGRPRENCLEAITEAVGQLQPGVRACVLLLDDSRSAVAGISCAHLPDTFAARMTGTPLPDAPAGTPASALRRGEPFACVDIAQDESWPRPWRELCLQHDIRACHATPVFDRGGEPVGAFLLCFDRPHEAGAWELQLAGFGAHLVGIAHERHRSRQALRRSEERLQTELDDTRLLQHLSQEVGHQENAQALYDRLVDAAMAIMRSDFASIQEMHPDRGSGGELHLLAHRGFTPAAAAWWEWVDAESASLCGEALRTGTRAIAGDLRRHPPMAGSRDLAACDECGIRAAQTTPLLSRDGELVGMLSTHWRQPHTPSERDLRLLDILCRQAADLIERQRAYQALRKSEARYHNLFDSIDEGFCVLQMVFDDAERACDARYVEVNPAFHRLTGLQDVTGRRMRELIPDVQDHWLQLYGDVALSGQPRHYSNHSTPAGRWYDGYAFRIGEPGERLVAVLFTDVTARVRSDEAVRESESRFRHLADHSPMMVWTTEADGGCNYLSQSWYEFTGQDEASGRGWGWLDAVHPDEAPAVREAFMDAHARAEPFRAEYRLRRHDGVYRWSYDAASPRKDSSGRLLGYVGSVLDIHERKQAENDMRFLLELGERIRQQREGDRLLRDASQALGEYLEVKRCYFSEVVEDEDCWRVVHDYHRGLPSIAGSHPVSMFDPALLDVLRGGRMLFFEDTRTNPRTAGRHEATYGPLGLRAHVVVPLLRDGRWVSNLAVASDRPRRWSPRELGLLESVAERVWNAHERLASERRLRDADRRKDEFLATLAHELRNPLAPLRNCLQILRVGEAGQVDHGALHSIMERQLGHLVRLVDDLLEVSRITRGRIALQPEPVDMAEIVERAVETSRPIIDERGHSLVVDLPRKPVRLMADPVRLAQVVSNLLNNAAKYTDPGGRIVLAARREGDDAVLSVHDNGLGIAPEHAGDMFNLFTQAEHSLARAQGGLGIGLTLVRTLVELHGGSVRVRSEGVGQGSEFEVRLPLLPPDEQAPAESGPDGERTHDALRVLVVDDNREHADSLALLLSLSGHQVRTAYDGIEGVSAAASFDPDTVLLDIGMPRLDGYEACRRIRRQPGGGEKVMIAVTGWGQDEDRRRGEAAGFDAHLVKPVDPGGLLQVMDSLHCARQQHG